MRQQLKAGVASALALLCSLCMPSDSIADASPPGCRELTELKQRMLTLSDRMRGLVDETRTRQDELQQCVDGLTVLDQLVGSDCGSKRLSAEMTSQQLKLVIQLMDMTASQMQNFRRFRPQCS